LHYEFGSAAIIEAKHVDTSKSNPLVAEILNQKKKT
jgi:hypothetical protein